MTGTRNSWRRLGVTQPRFPRAWFRPRPRAGVTVLRALRKANIVPGHRLAVFGVGGLGHLAIQIGCGFGAAGAASMSRCNPAAKAEYETAFYCLRPTGTLLVVGL